MHQRGFKLDRQTVDHYGLFSQPILIYTHGQKWSGGPFGGVDVWCRIPTILSWKSIEGLQVTGFSVFLSSKGETVEFRAPMKDY